MITWIDLEDIGEYLGIDAEDLDDYATTSIDAANEFAFRRRQAAGYEDPTDEAPNPAAKLGTILYAGALYRERGSIDSFQSFQDQPITAPIGSMGQILRLLGIGKPAIG
jgi:hypothetical protein